MDNGQTWLDYVGDFAVPQGGKVFARVDFVGERDSVLEGAETFTLTATYASGTPRSASGIQTITDDGTGTKYDGTITGGQPTGIATGLDDDRGTLSIPDVTVNEVSPYVVFKVFAASGETFTLALSDGPGVGLAKATAWDGTTGDYRNELEVYNGQSWIAYVPGAQVQVPTSGSLLLVRAPIVQDTQYESAHVFTLTATAAMRAASGQAIIGDFGTGAIFNDSGEENRTAPKDDDRQLKVNSPIVNEGLMGETSFAVFTVTGITDPVGLALNIGSGTGYASITTQPQYWDGTAWQDYADGSLVKMAGSSELLVRVNIDEEKDNEKERAETFQLIVTGTGGPSIGVVTIRDDGTGVKYTFDGTGALSGTSTTDLDDDFDFDGITPTTETALADLAASQGIGSATKGDKNGDGLQDQLQNSLATLAWITKGYFQQGNDGTLVDSRPIISIGVIGDTTTRTIDDYAQLQRIEVLTYAEIDPATEVVRTETATGIVNEVTLGTGEKVTTPWDPIRFAVVAQDRNDNLKIDPGEQITDVMNDVAGTQVRVLIDVRASGLTTSDVNHYIKYVEAAAIAAGTVRDLNGNAITTAGWYDFTAKLDANGNRVVNGAGNQDGARFVVENGRIVAIELIITDNAFGDNDTTLGSIYDPGVPVWIDPPTTSSATQVATAVSTPATIQVTPPVATPIATPIMVAETPATSVLYYLPLPNPTPIDAPAPSYSAFDLPSFKPALYVLPEVQRSRTPESAGAGRIVGMDVGAEPHLYVLPAVNASQAESYRSFFRQPEGYGDPHQEAGSERETEEATAAARAVVPQGEAIQWQGGEETQDARAEESEPAAAPDERGGEPADDTGTEEKGGEQKEEAKKPGVARVNFSDQLRQAARGHSVRDYARALEHRLRA